MDIQQIKSGERSPEGLAWRLLICAALIDDLPENRRRDEWLCGWQKIKNVVLPPNHPFNTPHFTTESLWSIDKSKKTDGKISIETYFRIIPIPANKQVANAIAEEIRDKMVKILGEFGTKNVEVDFDPPYEIHSPEISGRKRTREADTRDRSNPFLRENEAGIDIYLSKADWAQAKRKLLELNKKLSPPDKAKFCEDVGKIGIDAEHAGAMYDVLERQRQEFEKGPNGNPLPLSGPNGLMDKLQKASGVSQTQFFVRRGGINAPSRTRLMNEEGFTLTAPSTAKFIRNIRINLFAETIFLTAGIDTRKVEEIILQESEQKPPNWGRMLKSLRESFCLCGDKPMAWMDAVAETGDISDFSQVDFGHSLGGYVGSAVFHWEHNNPPGKEKYERDVCKNVFEKPIDIFSITEPALKHYKKIIAATVSAGKEEKPLSSIVAEAEKEAGRKSLSLLLSKLTGNLCMTEHGVMTWQKAVRESAIPYRLIPDEIKTLVGSARSYLKHCLLRPLSGDASHVPTEDDLEKAAQFFSEKMTASGVITTKAELLGILTEFRTDTIRHRDAQSKMPGAAAAGATGEPALAPDLNREPETSPPSLP